MRVLNDNNQWVGDGQVIDAEPRVWDRRYGPHPSEREWKEIERMSDEFVKSVVKEFNERRINVGQFRVEVTAVGGHGCQRNVKDGEQLQQFCGSPTCPDCEAREFVRRYKRLGMSVEAATLTHWPGQTTQVQDDLITGKRTGSF